MESSGPSANASEPPSKWAAILGTAIAILTIAIPTLVIAYYSSPVPVETLQRTTHVPRSTIQ
ncbi:hypothetical protein [Spirulina subsalsa]|uniref:hypothetical protein n=1 Tax=Spirulina subsalsa TaxID=54311 RepID=UPI0008FBA992|nr:hypothetical protein [Spirulina subsalsa]